MNMKPSPFKFTIWFVSCVGFGLYMASQDGVGLDTVILTALIMSSIALAVALVWWLVGTGKIKDR